MNSQQRTIDRTSLPKTEHLHGLYHGHRSGNLGESAVLDVFDRALPDHVRLMLEVYLEGDWRMRPQTQFIHHHNRTEADRAFNLANAAVVIDTALYRLIAGRARCLVAKAFGPHYPVPRSGQPLDDLLELGINAAC